MSHKAFVALEMTEKTLGTSQSAHCGHQFGTGQLDVDLITLSMPSSNRLSFLRPLYDIAVWQFILMLGFVVKKKRRTKSDLKFTWKMHEVVANFVCKLLDARPFDHLKAKMNDDEVKTATEGWQPGERATKKMIEWCQDQWRRKNPAYPKDDCAFSANEPCAMPWFDDMPVCFNCGVPCPECRNELAIDIPVEMSTAHAILDFDKVHANTDGSDELNEGSSPSCSEGSLSSCNVNVSESREVISRMTLRSSRKN